MIEENILALMRSVLKDNAIDETCSQKNCEKWDSMSHLDLVVELEMEFGISLEPEEIGRMTCFDEVVKIVKSKVDK